MYTKRLNGRTNEGEEEGRGAKCVAKSCEGLHLLHRLQLLGQAGGGALGQRARLAGVGREALVLQALRTPCVELGLETRVKVVVRSCAFGLRTKHS